MKIFELIGVKKFQGKTRKDVEQHAEKEGKYKILGAGYAGTAVEYKGMVYKFWSSDPPYEEFVKYALANQNNPFLPKFFSKKINNLPAGFLDTHEDHPETIKWIKMEKLQQRRIFFKVTESGKTLRMKEIMRVAVRSQDAAPALGWTQREYIEKGLVWDAYSAASPKWHQLDHSETPLPGKLTKEAQALANTLYDLTQIAQKHKIKLDDAHDSNYMLRGEQVVLIDPFWTTESVELNNKLRDYEDKMVNALDK
jgi:hypothetical protein